MAVTVHFSFLGIEWTCHVITEDPTEGSYIIQR